MLRKITALCLFFIIMASAGAFAMEFKAKPKLAFYPLVARSVEAIPFTEALSTQLFNSIERTDFFEIVERKKVEGAIAQDAATLAAMPQDSLYNVATKAGFDVFILGNVGRADNMAIVDLKLVGSNSRNAYFAGTFRIPEFELQQKMQEMVDTVVAKVKSFSAAPPPTETKIGCPANLTVSGTPKSIKLKWAKSDSPQVIGYAVMRSSTMDGAYLQIATTTKPGYTDDNLKLNETYYYKVKAISKSGIECELTAPLVGKTAPAPLPPIFIDIKTDLAGARLNWYSRPYSGSDRNQVTTGFQIHRKAADETDFSPIAKVDAKAVTYLDSDMRNGVSYSYALTAFNPDGVESELSSVLDAKVPQAVSNLKAAAGNRKIQLGWTPNDSKIVEGYAIYRSDTQEGGYKSVGQVRGRSSHSFADSGLEDGSTYWYRVSAVLDGKTETPLSDAVSAATRPRPASPTGLTASSGEPRRVVLSWLPRGSAEDGLKGYNLYRAVEKDGEFVKIAELGLGKNSFTDDREKGAKGASKLTSLMSDGSKPLTDGATYYYRITCFNEAGSESLPSEAISATTRPLLPSPQQLKATSGLPAKVTINWESTPEFKEYEVYRGTVGQNEVTRIKTVKEPFYVDSSVDHGTSYIYAVKGIDSFGIPSIISTSVTGSTKARPAAPKGVMVKDLQGRKVLEWQANPEKDVFRYNVYKKNFVGMFLKQQTVFGTTYPIEAAKGKHELRVTAEDGDGLESDKSDVVTIEIN